MKLTDFSIQSIEITHEKALELKQKVIDAIEKIGIENFEKKREFELEEQDNDPIKIWVICEIYQEFSDSFQAFNEPPQLEELISRSVMTLLIKVYNEQGDEVQWTILGEKVWTQLYGHQDFRWFTRSPIDIEEEIEKHFKV